MSASILPQHAAAGFDETRYKSWHVPEVRQAYDERDTMFYALSVGAGLGRDDELKFVFEKGVDQLVALPTMAVIIATPGFWLMDEALGVNWPQVLHGEQSLRLHRPLEATGDVICRTTLGPVADKGPGKPVLLQYARELSDAETGAPVATMEEVYVLRGAGGYGGVNQPVSAPMVSVPKRSADGVLDLPTFPQQAMLYRLNGDRNPLHIDPTVAKAAGLARPVLHGLSTFGVVGRALVHLCCGGDPKRLSGMRLRFTSPVFPGDVIRTEVWEEDQVIRFRASVPARGDVVVDSGTAQCDNFDAA
jgi:acyl dehydratase